MLEVAAITETFNAITPDRGVKSGVPSQSGYRSGVPHPTTTRMAVIRRECSENDAHVAKVRLTHARVAGLLTSYGDDAFYDASTCELIVYLHADRMHPANRGDFDCERTIAELAVERAIALHRVTSRPPP